MSACVESKAQQLVYADNAVLAPVVPSKLPIKKLDIGDMIIICGQVPSKSTGFNINLDHRSDTLLHISVRIGEKKVVRNTRLNQSWGKEERNGGLGGIGQGGRLDCLIMITNDAFKVAFNGQHFCNYAHRADFRSISQLAIAGSLIVDHITFQKAGPQVLRRNTIAMPLLPARTGKSTSQKLQKQMSIPVGDEPVLYSPGVPLWHYLEGGMPPGRVLYLCGKPRKICHGFFINLVVGGSGVQRSHRDIALHIKANMVGGNSSVVCNSKIKGKWGPEIVRPMPFSRGVHFDMVIICEAPSFKISVNNQHMAEFKHRVNQLNAITDLQIEGDVDLIHMRFQ